MTTKIDYDAISVLLLEINDRIKLIQKIFPKDKEQLLKHFAAAAIHMTLFASDLFENRDNGESKLCKSNLLKTFLDQCGCKEIIQCSQNSKNNITRIFRCIRKTFSRNR